ncbi:hypothetical protein M8C21_020214 [Ambrosia artemisiifolia]|uniref:Uncharacterized protein n=1 Tax=Ambrosia artemisiifolia TaxID=4212 RepID=A0AAD5CY80_AMBAR|nr:hypothetical protein M8C21_020214 [Ambrosia artemisiifolia]
MDKPPVITPITAVDASVASLSKDITSFATNRQVPKELDLFVDAPEDTLEDWFEELSKAWNERETTPTPEEAAILVLESLRKLYHPCPFEIADVQGFLSFYELPDYHTLPKPTPRVEASPVTKDAQEFLVLNTLPVSKNDVKDGANFTVSVEVKAFHLLPSNILAAICNRRRLSIEDKRRTPQLLEEINAGGYEVTEIDDVTKKYEIKLRGLEESGMPNGVEAREMLAKMVDGKCLMIKVLYLDEQLRCVGDAYYNGICLKDELRTAESATCHDHTPGVSEENTLVKRVKRG